jgi:hypothetical protein
MYIARQVAYSPVHAQKLLDGTKAAFDLVDEIRHAVHVVDYGATFIEYVTDDRNGDAVEDTIRYEWSGSAGDPLTRSFNRSAPASVMDDVHEFQLDYTIETASHDLQVLTMGSELQLAPQYGNATEYELQSANHLAQAIDLGGLPPSTKAWWLTKIRFEAEQASGADGQFVVQLRNASSDGSPTSEVLAQYIVPESSLPSSRSWFTLTLPQPVTGLSPHKNYCIVFLWQSGARAAKIGLSNSVSRAFQTSDNGATWSPSGSWAQMIVYARPASADTPITIREDRLRRVAFSLQQGDAPQSRMDTAVSLANAPVVAEKAWWAEFDRDPTKQDVNGDGDGDFVFGGGTFDMATVDDGAWQTSSFLRAENTAPVTTPVVVDVRGQSLGTGGQGLVARAILRLGASQHADVAATLVREADGTQTAKLSAHDGAATQILSTVKELPAEPVDLRLVIEPARRLASLRVEGIDYEVVSIPAVNASSAVDSFTITEDVSNAEYDYAGFQITKSTP